MEYTGIEIIGIRHDGSFRRSFILECYLKTNSDSRLVVELYSHQYRQNMSWMYHVLGLSI